MLTIKIPSGELWDEEKEVFIKTYKNELRLEHSLYAISLWESKWKRAFIESKKFSDEEYKYYIKCMCVEESISDLDIEYIYRNRLKDVMDYISDSKTATHMRQSQNNPVASRDKITSELIYYWMVSFQIPFECQYWNLTRLLALIQVCNLKNGSQNKQSRKSIMTQNAALNAARRKSAHSRG